MKTTRVALMVAAILAVAGLCLAASHLMAAAPKATDSAAPKAAPAPKGAPAPSATTAAPAPPVVPAAPSATGFAFVDTAGQHLDIFADGKPVARWMYAHDAKREDTYKPYLHIYDPDGKAFITKGPGGLFTHHRGIFFGWQKIGYNGKTVNIWEMADGDQIQRKFLNQKADATMATFTVQIDWALKDGTVILAEERTMTVRRDAAAKETLIVDFSTKVKAVKGDLVLAGDPEHGGVQFRAADDEDRTTTKYCFPADGLKQADGVEWRPSPTLAGSKNYTINPNIPWAAESFSLRGKTYFVEEMSAPDNPKDTLWSAYRDYARFGAYPKADLKDGATLGLKYRFWIGSGKSPSQADMQKEFEAYTKDLKAEAAK